MRQSILALCLAPLALAADPSLTMFYPGGLDSSAGIDPTATPASTDLETPSLSIVSAAAQTTVAALGCGPQTTGDACLFSGFTYTQISTTVYNYHYTTDIGANAPLTIDVDCTGKDSAYTCATNMPNADKLTVSGVDPAELSAAFMTGTSTYTGSDVLYITAPVTAGQEKLQAAATTTPQPSKPQPSKNAAGRFGVETGAMLGALGAAAVARFL